MHIQFLDNPDKKYEIKGYSKNDSYIKITTLSSDLPSNSGDFFIQTNLSRDDCPGYSWCKQIDDHTYIFTKTEDILNHVVSGEQEILARKDEIESSLLAQKKEDSINYSKELLAEFLSNHPLASSARGGKKAFYTVTQSKQQQMYDTYSRYQNTKRINPNAKLYWNASGDISEEWNEDEYLLLMSEIEEFIRPLVIRQQEIENRIKAANTFEEVDLIKISY